MKILSTSLLATVLGLTTLTLLAQAPEGEPRSGPPPFGEGGRGGPGGPGQRFGSPLVRALDVNKDGKIDATELAQAATSLASLDLNKDGQITEDEMRPGRPQGGGEGPDGPGRPGGDRPPGDRPGGDRPPGDRPGGNRGMFRPPLETALDANKDGTISAAELANAPAALKALDKNNDGSLTPDELRGPRPGGDRGPGRGGPRPGPGGPDRE